MRLVCPNCVAQYEVADGTIPDSGRDVQCANCGHIWFQDAAFKLSTEDLTYVPQKLTGPRGHTGDREEDDEDDDAPGMFHSMRAAGASKEEVTSRALPEVGNNVLDILRSEAAFSSRRRAEALAGDARPAPQDGPGPEAAPPPIGTRAGDRPPDPDPAEKTASRDADSAAEDFRALAWRHIRRGAQDAAPAEDAATDNDDDAAPDDAVDADATGDTVATRPDGFWRGQADRAADDETDDDDSRLDPDDEYGDDEYGDDGYGDDNDLPDADRYFDEPDADAPDGGVTGLAADDAKRIAEAAVAGSYRAGLTANPPRPDADHTPEHAPAANDAPGDSPPPDGLRRVARRIPVRSLTEADTRDTDEDGAEARDDANAPEDEVAAFEEAAQFDAGEAPIFDDPADRRSPDDARAGTPFAASYLDPETTAPDDSADAPEEDADDAAEHDEDALRADDTGDDDLNQDDPDDEGADPDDDTSPRIRIDDPDDIRQVRRSLVENRKVLLPDVEELNTSLRMDKPKAAADLRASAFSEDAAANRSRFSLGLVTALMLFGILSALYLMGPAIADTFPAADPYVAAYRDFVDTSLAATARALDPVVAWLESL